ncbi:MAG: aminotransferase class I/II-fold pyridoxal phosphate-dependent enzyme, partial [Ilumatobacteraceae bacterium]
GPGWSSRILQAVLFEMLGHQPTIDAVAAARVEYARRRKAFTDVLAARDVTFTGTDGINLWVAVNDERSALLTLAAQGIGAAPGEPFIVRTDSGHLRLTVGLLDRDAEHVAIAVAEAAGPPSRLSGNR